MVGKRATNRKPAVSQGGGVSVSLFGPFRGAKSVNAGGEAQAASASIPCCVRPAVNRAGEGLSQSITANHTRHHATHLDPHQYRTAGRITGNMAGEGVDHLSDQMRGLGPVPQSRTHALCQRECVCRQGGPQNGPSTNLDYQHPSRIGATR